MIPRMHLPERLLALMLAAGLLHSSSLPADDTESPCPVRAFGGLEQSELSDRIYACFGAAAANLNFREQQLDRLTVLARLATEVDPAARRVPSREASSRISASSHSTITSPSVNTDER